MNVQINVNNAKEVVSSHEVQSGAGARGEPLRLQAQRNVKYQLIDEDTGFAPENVATQRVGNDLHIAFEGADVDQPDVIVAGYYDNPGAAALVGQGESGVYYNYVPESGVAEDALSQLGVSKLAGQALGGDEFATPFWIPADVNPMAALGLLPLAGLAGGGGGSGGGDSSSVSSNSGAGGSGGGGGRGDAGGDKGDSSGTGSSDQGSGDNGSDDNGGDDDGSGDNGSDDNGSDDNGSDDNGSDDNGGDDNGGDDNGSDDNGSDDNGGDDNGNGDNGNGDNGSGDGDENTSTPPPTPGADTTAPTVQVTIHEDGTVSFHFSEEIKGFDASSVIVTYGCIDNLQPDPDHPFLWTAELNPEPNCKVEVAVPAESYTDLAGNQGKGDSDYVMAGPAGEFIDVDAVIRYGGADDDHLTGGSGDDVLLGGLGDDLLDGDAGDDLLLGGDGDDYLYGGLGDDVLYGGAGDDILHGGAGDDIMHGGPGADQFMFDGNANNGNDVITDFSADEGDKLVFTGIDDLADLDAVWIPETEIMSFNNNGSTLHLPGVSISGSATDWLQDNAITIII